MRYFKFASIVGFVLATTSCIFAISLFPRETSYYVMLPGGFLGSYAASLFIDHDPHGFKTLEIFVMVSGIANLIFYTIFAYAALRLYFGRKISEPRRSDRVRGKVKGSFL
jgi:hypothetical protein